MTMKKYECPCCRYLTLDEEPPGTYLVCPVCFWEDDPLQFDNPDYERGANPVSLNQARANFLEFGASAKEHIQNVRRPVQWEKRRR